MQNEEWGQGRLESKVTKCPESRKVEESKRHKKSRVQGHGTSRSRGVEESQKVHGLWAADEEAVGPLGLSRDTFTYRT